MEGGTFDGNRSSNGEEDGEEEDEEMGCRIARVVFQGLSAEDGVDIYSLRSLRSLSYTTLALHRNPSTHYTILYSSLLPYTLLYYFSTLITPFQPP